MPDGDQPKTIEHLDREQTEQKEQVWLNDARTCRDAGRGSLNPEVGLAFSGGGVRSATFNLGVLQALASQDVLDKVGYISSVSGGSYINSWLAAWISKDCFQGVNRALADHEYKAQKSSTANSQEEAKNGYGLSDAEERYRAQRPIAHLRHYSSYLTPQKGILSSDVWTAVAAYLLRLAPNLLFVVLAATALIGLPYILGNFYRIDVDKKGWQFFLNSWPAMILAAIGIVTLVVGRYLSGYIPQKSTASRKAAAYHSCITFAAMLLLGPALAVVGIGAFLKSNIFLTFLGLFLLALLSAALFSHSVGLTRSNGGKPNWMRMAFTLIVSSSVGAAAFALATMVFALFYRFPSLNSCPPTGVALATVFGPALLFLAYVAMASAGVTMLRYESGSQEWLNRIWGDTAILTLNWTITASISLLWPILLAFLQKTETFSERFPHIGWPVLGSWLLTTVASILSAFSSKTSGPPTADATPTPWRVRTKQGGNQYPLQSFLARISPYLFGAGLLILLSTYVSSLIDAANPDRQSWHPEFWLVAVCAGLALLIGAQLDVNRLSLHNFYRFRLIECYLAASRRNGAEAVRMADLTPLESDAKRPSDWNHFNGPFPIINCTLNVTKGDSLDLQKRRARNFIFTPTACGFTRFGDPEMPAPSHLRESAMISSLECGSEAKAPLTLAPSAPHLLEGITLGAAMAISGAAQSPNQGSHTSPAVAALLTLANIRLGWWLGNPRNKKTYKKEGPDNGLLPMIDELLAQATDENGYVYLSDGGHFENLGLYELIRRRCELIILCDADCDPKYKFDDLVNAIELCQVDFGATITIDTDPLQNTLKAGWCRSAFTVGTIKYASENETPSKTGTLVYLKSAVTRENSIVVHSYDRQSRHFPHEPTTNQWFDETQFEAYRLLGLETADSALKALKKFEDKKKKIGNKGNNGTNGSGAKDQGRESLNYELCSGAVGERTFMPPLWWNAAQAKCDWSTHARRALRLLWPDAAKPTRVEKVASVVTIGKDQ
jgi:hypothetical protein